GERLQIRPSMILSVQPRRLERSSAPSRRLPFLLSNPCEQRALPGANHLPHTKVRKMPLAPRVVDGPARKAKIMRDSIGAPQNIPGDVVVISLHKNPSEIAY